MFAAFLESTIFVEVMVKPLVSASKTKRDRPSLLPFSPEVLQAIMTLSAKPPSTTNDFSPEMEKFLPSFFASHDIFRGS